MLCAKSLSLSPSVFHVHTHVQFFVCGTRGEPATFGSLGMVVLMGLEAAIMSKVICQSPDQHSPLGIVYNISFSLKGSPRHSHKRTAEQGLGVHGYVC